MVGGFEGVIFFGCFWLVMFVFFFFRVVLVLFGILVIVFRYYEFGRE